jgi:hypothetical protein
MMRGVHHEHHRSKTFPDSWSRIRRERESARAIAAYRFRPFRAEPIFGPFPRRCLGLSQIAPLGQAVLLKPSIPRIRQLAKCLNSRPRVKPGDHGQDARDTWLGLPAHDVRRWAMGCRGVVYARQRLTRHLQSAAPLPVPQIAVALCGVFLAAVVLGVYLAVFLLLFHLR